MKNLKFQTFWPVLAMALLFFAAVFLRPIFPIDETRYISAAWEMKTRSGWFAPLTINFQPYHHKPPMLFWMMNMSWAIFGVSRWAALLPIALAATGSMFAAQKLGQKLFKADGLRFDNVPVLMVGSVPFMAYSTLIMFDVTLMFFVLLTMIAMVSYAQERNPVYVILMGLALGLGLLTKGPVAWLYIIFPILFAPYWMEEKTNLKSWYYGCFVALLLSTIPVLMWIIPVLKASNPDFAFYLLWEQTAGRVSGNMENVHARPIYFYLPLLLLLFLPWAFFPSFWRGVKTIRENFKKQSGLRFLALCFVPVFIAFSLIGGKQPHYLVPLLPAALIMISYAMQESLPRLLKTSIAAVLLCIGGQAIASQTAFVKYDLQPIADYVQQHPENEWVFVRKYHGELTYLARMEKPIENIKLDELDAWFAAHPNGLAVIRYDHPDDVLGYEIIQAMEYRGKHIGIFKAKSAVE